MHDSYPEDYGPACDRCGALFTQQCRCVAFAACRCGAETELDGDDRLDPRGDTDADDPDRTCTGCGEMVGDCACCDDCGPPEDCDCDTPARKTT